MDRFDIALISADQTLAQQLTQLARDGHCSVSASGRGVETPPDASVIARANIVVVDVDPARRDHLLSLQSIMMRASPQTHIIVLADACSEAVQRWFMQIRVSDLIRKPPAAVDIMAACKRLMSGVVAPPSDHAQVTCFLPAAGGVGNTTLAIEAAIQMLSQTTDKSSVALVDLDLHNDACADFLDLEPRLDFSEVGEEGERFDKQLLEAMISRHSSGLALIAAPSVAGELRPIGRGALLRLLDTVAASFEHVVIDLPRTWHVWTDDVLVAADRSYIVTDMTVPGLRFARRLTDQVIPRLNIRDSMRVIVNRFDQRMFGSGLRRADVVRTLENVFAGEVPNNYQLVREAIDRGVPLEAVKPGNNISAAVKRIVLSQQHAERIAS
ncbi:MAG: response regulator receiver protein [Hyphomicrobiales bacterium]|nr:response regulator receiver protein [Hyphomicrobiales bacterium]